MEVEVVTVFLKPCTAVKIAALGLALYSSSSNVVLSTTGSLMWSVLLRHVALDVALQSL